MITSCRYFSLVMFLPISATLHLSLVSAKRAGATTTITVVSDAQGLKLVGLIGVKRDAGVVLDARLLEIQFTRAAREEDRWVVETRERWYYKDRKIGSGEQVGDDSTDSYAVRYRFTRKGDKLILEELEFVGEPVVGRKAAPMPVDPRVLHGLPGDEGSAGASAGRGGGHSTHPPTAAPPQAPGSQERKP